MKREYDAAVEDHYRQVALEQGLSPRSTMLDDVTRETETQAITAFVASVLSQTQRPFAVLDAGCGNGYSLSMLAGRFAGPQFVGVEKSEPLLALARSRFSAGGPVEVWDGDLRDRDFARGRRFDLVICQRVIINLLNIEDQRLALDNLLVACKDGGALLFIEAFKTPLDTLNRARGEFGLPPIPPAHHNLLLADDFFARADLQPFAAPDWTVPANFLSTHYFVTRVFHAAMLGERPLVRNSEFVAFFSRALPQSIGDYAPLKLCAFRKRARPSA